jgi:hypothetical protein
MATGKKTGGRVKGTPNKENKALREMILQALDDQPGGGIEYLKLQATENPNAFMSLLGKVLPTTLIGDKDNPVSLGVVMIPAKNG